MDKTVEILTNKTDALDLSIKQYHDVTNNRNIDDYIEVIENEYIRINI